MDSDKEELFSILRNHRGCHDVGDGRIRTRCILCGDSKKDPHKMRLNIKCDPHNPTEPVMFICFNCGESGILTTDMLAAILGGENELEMELLRRINKTARRSDKGLRVNKYKGSKVRQVIIPPPRKQMNTVRKIQYMNKRIGVTIPLEDYQKLKLIFSLQEFLVTNQLGLNPKYEYIANKLENDYLGWLSVDNEYIIFRDITGNHKERYVKYKIDKLVDSNIHSFYGISNQVNVISQNPIHIIATEGPFDILSVVYNMYGKIVPDCIFLSVNHGLFLTPILYYLNKGIVGSNIYIDIYRDSDSVVNYTELKNDLKIYTRNFTVYRNVIGKDFGVPKDQYQIERETY